ncbi:MFS transporter [Egibacter rhizosphaerae]|uniref:Tetracycline resistance protein n=1 Tax=Egibacter rhizosphaerae TaxID=1670831 RepID=A0A411YIK2_9ACTN|nr:MFS transporter [Egibacter rhizosphaerae]QBI20959.1 MFS transporter [Egibacter rhizosphaerae]
MSRTWLALPLGSMVALMIIGSSGVAVALPTLSADLGLDVAATSWVLASFGLTLAVATAVFGRWADLVGLRRPLLVGVALVAAGSMTAATAGSFEVLIAGRLVQGAGGGAVPVVVTGLVTARFSGAERARMLGVIGVIVSIVSGSGPLIGGAIEHALSWRAVVGLPVLVLLLVLPVARLATTSGDDRGVGLDLPGALLTGTSVGSGMVLLQAVGGTLAPLAMGGVAVVAAVSTATLVVHVRRRPRGFLPRRLLGDVGLRRACLAGFATLTSWLAMLLAVPELLAGVQGWEPWRIGVAMVPGAAIGALASRAVSTRRRQRDRGRIAAGLLVIGAVGLAIGGAAGGEPAPLVLGLALVAACFGGAHVVLLDAVPDLVPEGLRGGAIGLFNLAMFTGGAVGAALAGGLAGMLGLRGALVALSVFPLVGAVAALGVTRGTPVEDVSR